MGMLCPVHDHTGLNLISSRDIFDLERSKSRNKNWKMQNLNEETFVRHLPYSVVIQLASMLDVDNHWEELASKIPKKPDGIFSPISANVDPRYSVAHISKFARHNANNGSSTKALLADWGTQNSRLKHLIEALSQAQLGAAAQYLRGILPENPEVLPSFRSSNPSSSPAVGLPANVSDIGPRGESTLPIRAIVLDQANALESHRLKAVQSAVPLRDNIIVLPPDSSEGQQSNQMSHISDGEPPSDAGAVSGEHFQEECLAKETSVPQPPPVDPALNMPVDDDLKEVRYDVLRKITNNFDNRNLQDGGSLIGVGGFGEVFLGTFNTGFKVAVKVLMQTGDEITGQFRTEVETLCKFKHENLVLLLGYSTDGNHKCLIYQYMPNGSLEDRLACRFDTPPLANSMRIDIAKGTARGITFLHEGGLTHRDIKSANILLDSQFNPKVGDFATAKVAPSNLTTYNASVVIGTQAYLAPEAFSFVIHPGLDCFSFGVVLLEILTGLPVVDPGRENVDIKIHVQEHCAEGDDGEEGGSFYELLDTKGGEWDLAAVDKMYALSNQCFEQKKKRPKMAAILSVLEQLNSTT
ncbi:unnamed protein product [Lymnaea stagnalis]|uniref:non-specific serine/threonine protein kinase n=1 Tax=Lymnaea stagnalis TaxID=6523 RepID=A0AAV2IGF3_LYMST